MEMRGKQGGSFMNDCLLLCNLTAFHVSDADNNVQSVVDET